MNRLALAAFLVALATPAFANDYPAGFNYQPQHSPGYAGPTYRGYSSPSYGYGYLPRRTVTTITPLSNGGKRIETRRYYGGGTATFRPHRGRW